MGDDSGGVHGERAFDVPLPADVHRELVAFEGEPSAGRRVALLAAALGGDRLPGALQLVLVVRGLLLRLVRRDQQTGRHDHQQLPPHDVPPS